MSESDFYKANSLYDELVRDIPGMSALFNKNEKVVLVGRRMIH